MTCVFPYAIVDAPNWVAEHLGASSWRPRHPFPALMAGVHQVHGPTKAFPSRQELQLRRTPQFSARLDPMTLMVMSPYRYTSHFSLRHLSFNVNREIVVVVGANIVIATEPIIEHGNTPNVNKGTGCNWWSVFPSRLHADHVKS